MKFDPHKIIILPSVCLESASSFSVGFSHNSECGPNLKPQTEVMRTVWKKNSEIDTCLTKGVKWKKCSINKYGDKNNTYDKCHMRFWLSTPQFGMLSFKIRYEKQKPTSPNHMHVDSSGETHSELGSS